MIPEAVRKLVQTGPLAHLTTLKADGSPQVTVVWIGIEDDEFVIGHLRENRKVANIRRESRVALSFLGQGRAPSGLHEYVVAYGKARITEGGAVELLHRLGQVYIGPGADFPPAAMRSQLGFVTRIRPERFAGVGPWDT